MTCSLAIGHCLFSVLVLLGHDGMEKKMEATALGSVFRRIQKRAKLLLYWALFRAPFLHYLL